jgi:hypothetical protein
LLVLLLLLYSFDHVSRSVFLLQPAQNDFGLYVEKPDLGEDVYVALLVKRPIKIYTSVSDDGVLQPQSNWRELLICVSVLKALRALRKEGCVVPFEQKETT